MNNKCVNVQKTTGNRYFIKDIKCAAEERDEQGCGGLSSPGIVLASVKVRKGNEEFWLTNIEVDGVPVFFKSKEDCFDIFMENDIENFAEIMTPYNIEDWNGINLEEYDDIYKAYEENPDNRETALLMLVVVLTRASWEDSGILMQQALGKFLDEITITKGEVYE